MDYLTYIHVVQQSEHPFITMPLPSGESSRQSLISESVTFSKNTAPPRCRDQSPPLTLSYGWSQQKVGTE